MKTVMTMLLVLTMALSFNAQASERPDHFEGKSSETLEQALTHFSDTNKRLAALLNKGNPSAEDLNEVHELTYTLENALAKIRDEYAGLAEVLEEIHLASESADGETVQNKGQVYLEKAGKLAP